mmetsp:Transcript_1782/g.3138  ORF Transcript_1782/g.3138 Transcript_1782/m.3138 type:complete len:138 (-) Transcript_1782:21-434(-)
MEVILSDRQMGPEVQNKSAKLKSPHTLITPRNKFDDKDPPEPSDIDMKELLRIMTPYKSVNTSDYGTNKSNKLSKPSSSYSQRIEYKRLRNFIDSNHPTVKREGKNHEVPFGVCEKLGSLDLCVCTKGAKRITDMAP